MKDEPEAEGDRRRKPPDGLSLLRSYPEAHASGSPSAFRLHPYSSYRPSKSWALRAMPRLSDKLWGVEFVVLPTGATVTRPFCGLMTTHRLSTS